MCDDILRACDYVGSIMGIVKLDMCSTVIYEAWVGYEGQESLSKSMRQW
jgi:hypothetical protein